jgi:hypothetical protein
MIIWEASFLVFLMFSWLKVPVPSWCFLSIFVFRKSLEEKLNSRNWHILVFR